MSKNVITVAPITPLTSARKLMKENKIRRLPVVDGDKLVGIITTSDIHDIDAPEMKTLTLWDVNETLAHLMVKGEMTPDPITVQVTDTIGHAAKLMLRHKVGGLPVIDSSGNIVGIITESDIFRAAVKTWGE